MAAFKISSGADTEFHGYELAAWFGRHGSLLPMQHSTLYRGLRRLEDRGLLESRWETPEAAQADGREGRPRRYYRLSAAGVRQALAQFRAQPEESRSVWGIQQQPNTSGI